MSIKMMKKAVIGAAGAVVLMAGVNAQAAVEYPGTYTFEGITHLTASIIGLDCNLSLTGAVDANGNLTVTSGSATAGDSLCSAVNLDFSTPWTGQVDDGTFLLDLENVHVTVPPFVDCEGTVSDVIFSNGQPTDSDPSYFEFDTSFDGCSIEGTLTVQDGDVNAIAPFN